MSRTVSILEGNTFVVSDLDGNIDASPTQTHGLFQWDTRFLSRWKLTVNGTVPGALSTDDLQYFSARFFLVPGTGTIYADSDLSIIRTRAVGDGFHEDLEVLNHRSEPVDLELRIDAAADFADIFEIKDALAKKGECYTRVEPHRLVLGYRRERYVRETWIYATQAVAFDETGISVRIHLQPQEEWKTCLDVVAAIDGYEVVHDKVRHGHGDTQPRPDMGMDLEEWVESAPKLTCDWAPLEHIYRRSLVDLAALRFFTLLDRDKALPAAGLPWFMTIFGRDSILTSLQALPFTPRLAAAALRVLAEQQGRHDDPFRDEEPGKIIHEFRFGEMTAFEERPHSPYFGAADGTPLFLILMDEYERWTGDSALVLELEVEARAALKWIDEYGDRNGDGYVDYSRRNTETGLENQCWKDSPNSILFANGENSRLPRALCEIQGYVYDAKMRSARLARTFWNDYTLAARLESEAADLKRRFNEDFWVGDREFFALAIDGEGRKVDSLTSNIGHLLWSGIVDTEKAGACARHLMSDALYSGWGVRTMASTEKGYNPVGYHIGTVWPHDNSFIAWGLSRYGFRAEAARVAMGILQAATFFHYRLPEAFAGYPRQRTSFPVEYPTACSPQAWATGAPLLFLRTMLGLEPVGNQLLVDPAMPRSLARIDLLNIPGRWEHADAFGRGRIAIPEEGLEEPYLAIHLG